MPSGSAPDNFGRLDPDLRFEYETDAGPTEEPEEHYIECPACGSTDEPKAVAYSGKEPHGEHVEGEAFRCRRCGEIWEEEL